MNILAGDIGGTHSRLMLAEIRGSAFNILRQQIYPSQQYKGLVPVVKQFLQAFNEQQQPLKACFAVAGPVHDNAANITNLPWTLSAGELSAALDMESIQLINDFEGIGYGIARLGDNDFFSLQEGRPEDRGTRVILGAGTGLGQCMLTWCNDHYDVHSSEGGHADFAAHNEQQINLLQYLLQRQSRVSYEDLLSGKGLLTLYNYLYETGKEQGAPVTSKISQDGDAAAIIAQQAENNQDKHAVSALSWFMSIYGACAGDLALSHKATGGVFITGGIARKNLAAIKAGEFIQAFVDKPPMTELLQTIPVKVIVNPDVGLLGALEYCMRNMG